MFSTTAPLNVEHKVLPKLTTNLCLNYGTNDYPAKEPVAGRAKFRDDTSLGWGATVTYEIQKWLTLGADYSHSQRDSNFVTSSFKDEKIAATLSLQF